MKSVFHQIRVSDDYNKDLLGIEKPITDFILWIRVGAFATFLLLLQLYIDLALVFVVQMPM
jgi:hypothetical protein